MLRECAFITILPGEHELILEKFLGLVLEATCSVPRVSGETVAVNLFTLSQAGNALAFPQGSKKQVFHLLELHSSANERPVVM